MSKIEKIQSVDMTPLSKVLYQQEDFNSLLEKKKNEGKKKEIKYESSKKESQKHLPVKPEAIQPVMNLSLLEEQRNSLNDIVVSAAEKQPNILSGEKLKSKVDSLYVKTFEEKKNILK